ncbi:MAG: CoA transferase [Chloroflexi bacterium]|nr:CoA transferase [Chloroflexota bacterium]
MSASPPIRPLHGLRVLDLTQMAAGPFGTMLLADAGAEVIKVERLGTGDIVREIGPFRTDEQGRTIGGGILRYGRNKRSLALNLADPTGQEVFRQLARSADVVWENFAPGTMEKFGLAYPQLRELNPRLVYVAVSGFGHTQSPFAQRPAYDLIAQALSGVMHVTGQRGGPPTATGVPIGDLVPALFGTIGALLALQLRTLTGVGQKVDVAMYDSLAMLCERPQMTYALTGEVPTRGEETLVGPYDVYRAKDGYVAIAAAPKAAWTRLCQAIEREDLLANPELTTPADRARNNDAILRPILDGWLGDRTKAEATEYLTQRGVPAGPVQTVAEMMACPHIAARQMIQTMSHPVAGDIPVLGNPIKFSDVPEPEIRPVPDVGEHTRAILREAGYDDTTIARLAAENVVGLPKGS